MSVTLPVAHSAFEPVRAVPVPSLGLEVAEYRHRATGAVHYHLAADNAENVFLVGLHRGGAYPGTYRAVRFPQVSGSRSVFSDDPAFIEYLYECLYVQ